MNQRDINREYICPNHGLLLNSEIDEGGACLTCKDFYLVIPWKSITKLQEENEALRKEVEYYSDSRNHL